ncbi:heat shock protein, partial [Metarhizium hybridum]
MPQSASVIKALQDCVATEVTGLRSIRSPESLHQEQVKRITDASVSRLCEPHDADPQSHFKETLLQHSKSLRALDYDYQKGLVVANEEYERQVDVVLLQLCGRLIKTMGPVMVRATLESIARESPGEFENYLPKGVCDGFEESSAEGNSMQVATEPGVAKENSRSSQSTVTAGLTSAATRSVTESPGVDCSSYITRAQSKRQKTTPTETSPSRPQFEHASNSHEFNHQNENEVSLITHDSPADGPNPDSLEEPRVAIQNGHVDLQQGDERQVNGQDDVEALENIAVKVKKEALSQGRELPPFIQKLCRFLESKKNEHIIRWSDNGDSILILDENALAKTLIPEAFKHNSYASFVRMLNLYGFQKRVGLSDCSMRAIERKDKRQGEYYSRFFCRRHPNLLWLIHRSPEQASSNDGVGENDEENNSSGQDLTAASHVSPSTGRSITARNGPMVSSEHHLLNLTDVDGKIIESIKRPDPWSSSVVEILQIPVIRDVKIRPRRTFTEQQLAKVCNQSDPKGSRLLACLIQAGGKILQGECSWCQIGQGPFEECIILDGKASKCGNCEWTRHGCDAKWTVYQIKTTLCRSDASRQQCLRWVPGEKLFKLQVLTQSEPEEIWGDWPKNSDFGIPLREIEEVRWSAEAWRGGNANIVERRGRTAV